MTIGMIGLGRMGNHMRSRLRSKDIETIGYDIDPDVSDVSSISELCDTLGSGQHIVWLMLPNELVDETLEVLVPLLRSGDIVIDGGNSRWTLDAPRAERLAAHGISYLDCGVSGGVWGETHGYGIMIGGPEEAVRTVWPVLQALAPEDGGLVHAGGVGAGHFAKMVHNGIEYAMMQAYAEGYELLCADSPVTDVPAVFDAWRQGTVIRSWLLDLCSTALSDEPDLESIRGWADDSGEGRWTVEEAIDRAVPMPAISAALFARFSSRQDDSPAMKLIAAMRNQFGGHAIHNS